MKQHAIDLLPASIRARSQAGVRVGRVITTLVACIAILAIAATQVRLSLARAQSDVATARQHADTALELERHVVAAEAELTALDDEVRRYKRVALPLDVSAVIATVIGLLPPHVTLDHFDIDCGLRHAGTSPRSRGAKEQGAVPRTLIGEIAGFAATDAEITELVMALESTRPFEAVSLDYTRTRTVRNENAREFRVSFQIDLGADYRVTSLAAGEEVTP